MEEAICRRDSNRQQIEGKMTSMAKTNNAQIQTRYHFCPLDYSKLKAGNTKCWQGYRRQ